MIFISGVHGVGKSYFCNLLKERLGISDYTASQLIAETKQSGFSPDKKVADIDQNQQYLLRAVDNLRSQGAEFLLDGHFCLLNTNGEITRIPEDTFTRLNPDAIVLLTDDPNVIVQRRFARDHVELKVDDIARFQEAEIMYANEVAARLGVPLKVSRGSQDNDDTVNFISERV